MVVDESITAGDVAAAIKRSEPDLIRDVTFQSIFRSEDLGANAKCLAWSVTLRHDDRTLTEGEIREVEDEIWSSLQSNVGGQQRT